MARTKEFDEDHALERAMEVFWTKGYLATSLDDLVQGMGIARQSLYNTFGDKHALFVRGLSRYLEKVGRPFKEHLDRAESPAAALRALFRSIVDQPEDVKRRSCMLINTASELIPQDVEVTKLVEDSQRLFHRTFRAALERARARDELAGEHDLDALAHHLVASFQGLRLAARIDPSPAHLRSIAKHALYFLR